MTTWREGDGVDGGRRILRRDVVVVAGVGRGGELKTPTVGEFHEFLRCRNEVATPGRRVVASEAERAGHQTDGAGAARRRYR